MSEDNLKAKVIELEIMLTESERMVADLTRHNKELRQAIDALLQPAPSELFPRNNAHPSRRLAS